MFPSDPSAFEAVFDEAALPENGMEVVKVGGRRVALIRRSGKIHAIDNDCPHVGGYLGRGTLDGESVVCPLHHWAFDLATGRAVKGLPEDRVMVHEVRVEGGKIWVKLNKGL